MRPLYAFVFHLLGWKINGQFPSEMRKYIVALAPHTSNWDFLVGVAARSILRMQKTRFLGKSQLFRPPYGWLFRALGGYPVDRSSKHDMVRQVADLINAHDQFIVVIAPEGTRKKVQKLRTGFYYIAKAANIPIIPVGFDYSRKEVVIGEPLHPGESIEADLAFLHRFYANITGKNPELGLN
jgi:1-acyl-sn-glycerol-3-phosphate acyltransferase